jgi:hypothetical protein
LKNFSLVGEQEVRLHGWLEFSNAFNSVLKTATRIHCPEATGFFVFDKHVGKVWRAPAIRKMADQRSIEIRA